MTSFDKGAGSAPEPPWRELIITNGAAMPAPKPRRDETLVKALVRAHRWRRRIESGKAKSITDRAERAGVTDAFVCRLLPLTCLAPDIEEAILDGGQPGLRLAEMLGKGHWHGTDSAGSCGVDGCPHAVSLASLPRLNGVGLDIEDGCGHCYMAP